VTRPRLLRRAALSLGVAFLLLSGGLLCQRVAERGRFVDAYSSYGAGPDGARGIFLLAERLGAKPRRWSQDLAALPEGGGLLLGLSDCKKELARPLSRYERAELIDWVAEGGTLVVAGTGELLPDEFGVQVLGCERFAREGAFADAGVADGGEFGHALDGEQCEEVVDGEVGEALGEVEQAGDAGVQFEAGKDELPPSLADALLDEEVAEEVLGLATAPPFLGLAPIPMSASATIVVEPDSDAEVLIEELGEPERPPLAVATRHGEGRVVVLASASPLRNAALVDEDGAVMFARLIAWLSPRGPVLFDEYHLGVGERRSLMRYLRNAGMVPAALSLLLLALIPLWRAGARFGAIREPRIEAPQGTASYVTAMGRLFARSADPAGALEILIRQALSEIAAHHHLPRTQAQALADALSLRGLPAAAAAVGNIASVRGELAASRLDVVSRRIDALVAEACAAT